MVNATRKSFSNYTITDLGNTIDLSKNLDQADARFFKISKDFILSLEFDDMIAYMKQRAKLRLVEKWEAR